MKKHATWIIPLLVTVIPQFVIMGWPQMPEIIQWVFRLLSALAFISLIIIVVILIIKSKSHEDKQKNTEEVKSDLNIGVKVKEIKTYDYYSKSQGGGLTGDKEISLEVVLVASKPMNLMYLALELFGKNYRLEIEYQIPTLNPEPLFPRFINDTLSCVLVTDIPKEFVINTKTARVFARADNLDYYSEPFEINFGG